MQRTFLFCLLWVLIYSASAQYKNDNVLFKTILPQDLCKALDKNPGYLLLDVRSPGEYSDTSSSAGLNLGHLDGAMNIDIRQVGNRLSEISAYKNKPVFVYCSHSQRSRRVSKMLADSGFTNVNNINGGVSNLRMFGLPEDCGLLSSNLPYQLLSPLSLGKKNL